MDVTNWDIKKDLCQSLCGCSDSCSCSDDVWCCVAAVDSANPEAKLFPNALPSLSLPSLGMLVAKVMAVLKIDSK